MKVKSLSHVRLLVTAWIAAHQAPPSMGFSRQEYQSRLPLPSPNTICSQAKYLLAAAAATKLLHSCPSLCDPIDGSPPGSPIPGILQARTLEWVAKNLLQITYSSLLASLSREPSYIHSDARSSKNCSCFAFTVFDNRQNISLT